MTTTVQFNKPVQFDIAKESVEYFSGTTNGFRNVTRGLEITGNFGSFVRDLKDQGVGLFGKMAAVGGGAGALLAGSEFIQNLKDIEDSTAKLKKAKQLGTDNARCSEKVNKARTDLAMAGVSAVNSGSEFSIFILQTLFPAIVKLATRLAVVMNITTLITDGYAIYDGSKQCAKSYDKFRQYSQSPAVQEKYQFKMNLACMRVIKNTASVGLAVLGLLALTFAFLVESKLFIITGITLAAVFLVFNVAMHFYSRQREVQNQNLVKA